MTSSKSKLRSQYVDDGEPWQYLRAKGFQQRLGVMRAPVNHHWDDSDRGAVQYLCDEWGWTWSGQEVGSLHFDETQNHPLAGGGIHDALPGESIFK